MKTGIFGLLIGAGLFANGLIHHDQDEKIYIHKRERIHWFVDNRTSENQAYVLGMTGAIIATISMKHLLERNEPQSSKLSRVLVNAGLVFGGLWLHEIGKTTIGLP